MTQIPDYSRDPFGPVTPPYANAPRLKTSGFAIASLVCSLVGAVTCCAFVPSILGIAFGGVGLSAIRRGEASGRGLAIAGIVLGAVGAVVGIAFWIVAIQAPDNIPVAGSEMPEADRLFLESRGVVQEGERIELFYSGGFFSIREGGTVITANRIVLYYEQGDAQECPLSEISAIEFAPASSWIDEGQFLIERESGNLMIFSVNGQSGSDRLFHSVLTRRVNEAREAAGKPPAATEILSDEPYDEDDDTED